MSLKKTIQTALSGARNSRSDYFNSNKEYETPPASEMYNETTEVELHPVHTLEPSCGRSTQPIRLARLLHCDSGAAAVEFAFVLPVLLLLLLGVLCYGGYFWMAHDVQQLANDAARAAIAGLDATERSQIANNTVRRNLARQDGLLGPKTLVTVREGDDAFTVTVAYDASGSPFWALVDMLPMPSDTIKRTATVTLGGL